ncbi:MAG: DUF4097 family beta strand repeat protein [Bryobacterales bacterium]|nr:DUF4097 family beta strand repeat protein [Bryobacterales bacterium]
MRNQSLTMVGLSLFLLGGCDIGEIIAEGAGGSNRFREEFSRSYELRPGARLNLENFNGRVEIRTWDQNKVEIHGTKYASTEEGLKLLKVDVSSSPDLLEIRSIRPGGDSGAWRRGNYGVSFHITVPRQTHLDKLTTSNGPIKVDGIEGRMRLTTSNGPVEVASSTGELDLRTSNGPVELTRFSGRAAVQTSNGPIEVSALKLDPAVPLRLETSNGPIDIELPDAAAAPEVRAHSSNGPISLRLPDGVNARVRAHTSNSKVSTEFTLTGGERGKARLEGMLGNGSGPLFDLSTSNGPIHLTRR